MYLETKVKNCTWIFYYLFIWVTFAQCGNFMIFLSLRFYVKTILENLEVQNLLFFTHLGALNFDFYEFCTFWRLKSTKLTKLRAPKMAIKAVLELLDSPKLFSRKIWITEKFRNIPTVHFCFCKQKKTYLLTILRLTRC